MSEYTLLLGASSDIGRAIIRALPSGTKVLAHCWNGRAVLEALREEQREKDIVPIQADLSSREETRALIDEVETKWGCPGRIIQLAAPKLQFGRFRDLSWPDLDRLLEVQLFSTGLVLQRFLPKMAKSGAGHVVLVLSSVAEEVPAFLAGYVVAKHALLGLMRAAAAEYGGNGVRINAVSPSMVDTQYLSLVPHTIVDLAAERSPAKRLVRPDEVAAAVLDLLATTSCGQNVRVEASSPRP